MIHRHIHIYTTTTTIAIIIRFPIIIICFNIITEINVVYIVVNNII